MSPSEQKPWKNKAKDFGEFQAAIEQELKSKPPDSEWIVEIEVKKIGNPIHGYRIVLKPN